MSPTPSKSSTTSSQTLFDKRSFIKYMKDIGRAYRRQAKELVSIYRTFVQAQKQSPGPDAALGSASRCVDVALMSATKARTKSSKEADEKFDEAVQVLNTYEMKYHPQDTGKVRKRMAKAREDDQLSSKILNRLFKEKSRTIEPQPTTTVEFLIHGSLPDKSPTSVKQVLCEESHLDEVLWNFSRVTDEKKRLRLKQHPQFYATLPELPNEYGAEFRRDPTETFKLERVHVLTDKHNPAIRVFLETSRNSRTFRNVWVPKDAIILKDVCGKLEGESVVGAAIQNISNLWCLNEGHQQPPKEGAHIHDWREPILEALNSGDNVDTNIRITLKPPKPSNFGHSYPTLSSQRSQPPSSSHNASVSPLVHPHSPPAPPVQPPPPIPPVQPPPPTPPVQPPPPTSPVQPPPPTPPVQPPPPTSPVQPPPPTPPVQPSPPSTYNTTQNTPRSERALVIGPSPSITASPSSNVSPTSTPRAGVAPPPHSPTVTLSHTRQATPAHSVARTPPEISREPEPQRGVLPEVALSSAQVLTPPSGTTNTMSPGGRRTPSSHAVGNADGVDSQVPDQTAPSLPNPDGPQPQRGRRGWFRTYIVDPVRRYLDR